MPNTLCDLLAHAHATQFATNAGTRMHERLRTTHADADTELARNIRATPGLAEYFAPNAQTEVPIAGTVRGKFISRRIDRMIINHDTKIIKVLDYKTDTDRNARRAKYISQLREYCELLRAIYPDFKITTAILWTHEWCLEQI